MTGTLFLRGLFVGILAGFLAFSFAKYFGEPQVDQAFAFEEHLDQGAAPELLGRELQSGVGLISGVLIYSATMGGLFALAFAHCLGRVSGLGPRGLSALLALAAFVAVVVVPGLKYPANPPSIGDPDIIRERTHLLLLMVALSVVAMVIAINFARSLLPRHGAWAAALIGIALYLLVVNLGGSVFPPVVEVPDSFPAEHLWHFRLASLGIQLVMWTALGLIFGWLTERDTRVLRGSFKR
ncbi:CbtA family protein [Pseudomonas sp. RIT-To-2]|uniref:CbtA family protein n=1 Tax=Pseudomonas sp. RIT-To-2 TaxID=3462541 RepID=UPI0024138873